MIAIINGGIVLFSLKGGDITLEVRGLSFSYGKAKILEDIHFTASKGQIISLIGPNGSGKSTLLRCLCGLLVSENSAVYLFGKPIDRLGVREISREIAFLPQFHEQVEGTTVYELVAMGRAPYHKSGWLYNKTDREKIEWAFDYMQINHLEHRMVETLSGGEKQRVWIAMVLAQDTSIILLDEPVTYMDIRYQWELLDIIRDLNMNYQKTIISVFHDISHATEVSDTIYLLKNGRVHSVGASEEVITEKSIRDVYEIEEHVYEMKKMLSLCCDSPRI